MIVFFPVFTNQAFQIVVHLVLSHAKTSTPANDIQDELSGVLEQALTSGRSTVYHRRRFGCEILGKDESFYS